MPDNLPQFTGYWKNRGNGLLCLSAVSWVVLSSGEDHWKGEQPEVLGELARLQVCVCLQVTRGGGPAYTQLELCP